ncbi:MAG: OmpA family protein [Hydromonas sp.]|jgi:outer membrane protein OmpA-like peptidoglycan-associated protein|nr:OmpA family protein [Hydromonas sp.]
MSYENKDEDQKFALIVLGGIITAVVVGVLALCTLVGVGGGDSANAQKADASAMVAPAVLTTTAGAVSVAADEAKVVVENGVVKFYFASGKADLATGANEALAEVVKGVKAGQKAVVSGFHDNTGNLAANQELAKQRAISVRDTLVALGVPADSIELKKPENAEGTGDNAQARRVEVVLAK